ncbi:MAG TPA: MMPL family transporter [Candidatus Binatia bacterium]|nr:MMPL family transporter [Candidatus Binatia bacterium]
MTNDRAERRLLSMGRALIRGRVAALAVVTVITAFFAYHATQLHLVSRFDELLPATHPFVQVHRKFAKTFGGANTVLIMLRVREGDIFNLKTLNKIWVMTQELDKIYGVNHYQIESLAHRTNRTIRVSAGGLMEMQPVMMGGAKTQADVDNVRRIVHSSQNLYGVLVSIDNRAALIRASFIEGIIDHKKLFEEIANRIVKPVVDDDTEVVVAGEPQLYGWVYQYANQVYWILAATALVAWVLLYAYFRDWKGALRPTISGVIAAIWGLGFIHLIGFSLDPLTLVIPFFITARAVSHSAQMHERYYEEYKRSGWQQEEAIVRSFAALFVPTLSGILTDALGILAILLVPIVLLQKLALTASFWIGAIVVSELFLNPVVYSYLSPPDREMVEARERGAFQRWIDAASRAVVSPVGRRATLAIWVLVMLVSPFFWTRLVVGDSEAVTPLLRRDSPYNHAHQEIQEEFGGIEPLIIVVEAQKPGAMSIPANVRTFEKFQRFLERDPEVGASFSFVDVITTMGAFMSENEPKWGVIPTDARRVGFLFGAFFQGTSYAETARFMDPGFNNTALFFYCKNHRGPTIRRIIARAQQFIGANPLQDASFRMAGGLIGVLAAANEELVKNDVTLNVVGYVTIFIVVCLTYWSIAAGIYMLVPLLIANEVVNAYMGIRGIGINVQTLPVVTVGVGFGIDFAFYVVSRAREELASEGSVEHATLQALRSAGKAVTFTALTMIAGILFWTFSSIRFNAEMGLLLGLWMAVSFLASVTLLPACLVTFRPAFMGSPAAMARPAAGS